VASQEELLEEWGLRDLFGQMLMQRTGELTGPGGSRATIGRGYASL
jgi:hypothetical protein